MNDLTNKKFFITMVFKFTTDLRFSVPWPFNIQCEHTVLILTSVAIKMKI